MWRAAFFITICQYLIISWIIVLLSFMFPWSKVVGRKIIKGLVRKEKIESWGKAKGLNVKVYGKKTMHNLIKYVDNN